MINKYLLLIILLFVIYFLTSDNILIKKNMFTFNKKEHFNLDKSERTCKKKKIYSKSYK